MNDAGKISFLPKGEYDSGAMYEALDVVKYDGMVWAAKKSSKGITPVEGENWMCLLTAADYATADAPGIVKPDGTTITVDEDGTLHGQSKVDEMTGATADKDGTSGTVPAPTAGQEAHILNGDGTWTSPLDNKLIASKFKELDENKSDVVIDKSTGKKVVFTIENGIICAREA